MVRVEPGRLLEWEHRLEGTAFGAHLVRQSTEVLLDGEGGSVTVELALKGELRGAAKLAGPSLKGDQKKLLEAALARLKMEMEDGEERE